MRMSAIQIETVINTEELDKYIEYVEGILVDLVKARMRITALGNEKIDIYVGAQKVGETK